MRHLLFFMKNSSDQEAKVELNFIIAQTSFFSFFLSLSRSFHAGSQLLCSRIEITRKMGDREGGGSQIQEQPAGEEKE